MTTSSSLTPVRFYTALDPYYYTTDNRPLEDLNARDVQLAQAIDLVTGGSERSSMAAASIGQALIGNNSYAGSYTLPGGLVLRFQYGFAVMSFTDSVNPALTFPKMAIHDAVTSLNSLAAASTPGRAIKYLVQATFEEATPSSRIPADKSGTMVCKLTTKSSAEFVNDGQSTPTILPDANAISVLEVIIPYGKTTLVASDIKLLNYTNTDIIRQIVANGPVDPTSVVLTRRRFEKVVAKGSQYVPLAGSTITLTGGVNNLDVYVTGLYQHSFTVDVPNNRIVLGGVLAEAAEVMVVQTIPVKA